MLRRMVWPQLHYDHSRRPSGRVWFGTRGNGARCWRRVRWHHVAYRSDCCPVSAMSVNFTTDTAVLHYRPGNNLQFQFKQQAVPGYRAGCAIFNVLVMEQRALEQRPGDQSINVRLPVGFLQMFIDRHQVMYATCAICAHVWAAGARDDLSLLPSVAHRRLFWWPCTASGWQGNGHAIEQVVDASVQTCMGPGVRLTLHLWHGMT